MRRVGLCRHARDAGQRRNPAVSDKGPIGPLVVFAESKPNVSDKAVQIATLLAPTVRSLGLELLGAEYLPAPGSAVLRLYIDVPADAEEGRLVGIEDCEKVSREVSAQLDVEDPISGNYTLEVSSPGVDRPLFSPEQFARFVGEQAKVGLKLPQDGRRRLQGKIASVDGAAIVFEVDGAPYPVAFDNIDKARLMPDWVALGYGPAKDKSGRDARPGKQAKTPSTKRADASAGKPARPPK